LWPAQVDVGSKSPSVLFDYPQLLKCPVEGLAWAISERPQEAIPCLGIAVHEALFVDRWGPAWFAAWPSSALRQLVLTCVLLRRTGREDPDKLPAPQAKVGVRFANYEPVTPMKYLKSQCIGKFVSVKGTVIRVSTIKPVLVEMKFLCAKCGFETLQRMTEGRFEAPAYCGQVESCFCRPFLVNSGCGGFCALSVAVTCSARASPCCRTALPQ
jgi:DNA replicative helicase MCM subunit Mcm2 (Cdc46/Mcm family)